MNFPFILRVRGEPVGYAYGSENWTRAFGFLKIADFPVGLPDWITAEAWTGLVDARRRLDVEPSIVDLAKGYSGNGTEE